MRRKLRWTVVCLAAGFLSNQLYPLLADPNLRFGTPFGLYAPEPDRVYTVSSRTFATSRVYVFTDAAVYGSRPPSLTSPLGEAALPRFLRRPRRGDMVLSVEVFGWPFPCSQRATAMPFPQRLSTGHMSVRGAVRVGDLAIPVSVWGPGLLANTLVHAAVVVLLGLACVHVVRVVRRIAAGQDSTVCAGCGYDLDGLAGRPCPECGRAAQQ